jgi:hypothetical protein
MTIIRHACDDQMQQIVPLTALMLKQREREAIGKHEVAQISDYSRVAGRR